MVIINDYYNIQSIDSKVSLVTILSCEMTEVYWRRLMNDIKSLYKDNIVYVDFLFRNGLHDRYYKLVTKERGHRVLQPFQISNQIVHIADLFFAEHPVYIEKSILSKFQKNFYYNRLRRLFTIV